MHGYAYVHCEVNTQAGPLGACSSTRMRALAEARAAAQLWLWLQAGCIVASLSRGPRPQRWPTGASMWLGPRLLFARPLAMGAAVG